MCSDQVDPRLSNGGGWLERPLSSGKQVYQQQETNGKDPVYKPMAMAAAKLQVFHHGLGVRHVRDI